MIRTVIVPLDGSRFAEQALPPGAAIARASGTELRLVHVHQSVVFEGVPYAERSQQWDLDARRQELEYLDGVARRVADATGVEARYELLEGDPASAVLEHAQATGAELIVIATHGRGGVQRAWLGSVADELVRESNQPILLVRPTGDEDEPATLEPLPRIGRILIPLDGSTLAEHVLEPATRLGSVFGASYTLLRVVPRAYVPGAPYVARAIDEDVVLREEREREARDYLASVQGRLVESGLEVEIRVAAGTPAQSILEQADASEADAIAIATHGRGGAVRAFLGSVADKVVRGSTKPVLVYRPKR